MRYALLVLLVCVTTAGIAQGPAKQWGCLAVPTNPPGERLLFWCILQSGSDQIPCYDIPRGGTDPSDNLAPKAIVAVTSVVEQLLPNVGRCPLLPRDIPDVRNIRSN